MKIYHKNKIVVFFLFLFLFLPFWADAEFLDQRNNFFIDQSFAASKNNNIPATLQKEFARISFYFENDWWNKKTNKEKETIILALEELNDEFENNIYPVLTNTFGYEWSLENKKNDKIIVLFHSMIPEARGYVRNIDLYEKIVAPESNERKMIYLNPDNITGPLLRDYLAHEFMHLITFNQKDIRIGNAEDTWLNEARSEYVPTLLGYNDPSKSDNYLQRRLKSFIDSPSTSLNQWSGSSYNYGAVNVFVHYLVDHYGIEVLVKSLESNNVGIESINDALVDLGESKRFDDIFVDWVVALYVNDCSIEERYCYKNKNLDNFKIVPFNNFLPFSGEVSFSIGQTLSNYSAHWQRFTGSRKNLTLQFDGRGQQGVKVMYIIKNYSGKYEIKELALDENKKGEITINNLGIDKSFVTIIPLFQGKESVDKRYFYYITALMPDSNNNEDYQEQEIKLPFAIDKPLNQMNREELLMVIIRTIIYLLVQGKLVI